MHSRKSRLPAFPFLPAACACALLGACDGAPAAPGVGVFFAPLAGEGCSRVPASSRRLPEDLDRIVVMLRVGDGPETASEVTSRADADSSGAVLLQGVPPGTYRMQVAGCQGGGATWWGEDPAVVVEASQKTAPLIFMTPSQRLACVGSENRNPLAPAFQGDRFVTDGKSAFGAVAVGPSGRVVVAGGASDLTPNEPLVGGRSVWEYHPGSGLFTAARDSGGSIVSLAEARLGHGLAFIDEATFAVFGGAAKAEVSPDGFPGDQPPVLPSTAPAFAIEVVSLHSGVAEGFLGDRSDAWPAVAFGSNGTARTLALAGGMGADGKPTDRVSLIPDATPEGLRAGKAVPGRLSRPRFGGTAQFLSTGDLLVIGGRDDLGPVPPEVVRNDNGTLVTSVLSAGFPPAGGAATAFPAVALLDDDRATARVLVLGGTPLGGALAFDVLKPGQNLAWILTLKAKDGHYDLDTATVQQAVRTPEWALRSFGSLAPFDAIGSTAKGTWLQGGGFRSFRQEPDVADCLDAAGDLQDFCFPKSLVGFSLNTANELDESLAAGDIGRLGAAVAPIGPGTVLVLGGLSGYGSKASDRVQSSGVIAFAGGPDLDALCAAHPLPEAR